jgi:hypothetical protein
VAERDRRGITARIDRTNHVPVPINVIAPLKDQRARRGWTVICWITGEDNYRARAVYKRVAERTKWVTYDIKI